MVVQPIHTITPASPQREAEGLRPVGTEPAPLGKKPNASSLPEPAEDPLTLSDKAKAALAAARKREPLPRVGHFQLGGAEPLAFGPDQFASALTKTTEGGYRKPTEGVDLGHQPVRGLNLLG